MFKFPCCFYTSNIKEASETCFTIRGRNYINLEHVTTLRMSFSSTGAYIRWTLNYREYKRLQVKSFHVHNIIPYQNFLYEFLHARQNVDNKKFENRWQKTHCWLVSHFPLLSYINFYTRLILLSGNLKSKKSKKYNWNVIIQTIQTNFEL